MLPLVQRSARRRRPATGGLCPWLRDEVAVVPLPVERPLVLRPSAVVPRVAKLCPPERVSAHQSDHLLLREPKPLGDGENRREVTLRVGEAALVRRRTVRVVHPTRAEADRHVAAGSARHRHNSRSAAGQCPQVGAAERAECARARVGADAVEQRDGLLEPAVRSLVGQVDASVESAGGARAHKGHRIVERKAQHPTRHITLP